MQMKEMEDWLDMLREKGVTQFSCPDFTCTLGALPADEDDDDDIGTAIAEAKQAAQAPLAARGLFGDPRLWGGRTPPSFPKEQHIDIVPTHPDED